MALEHPGIVVLHEANLHHLIAELTIRRGDWDAYLREVEHDGGAKALAYARRYVRTLERGPDYDGVPMLRRLLEHSRGVIVHSDCVGHAARATGFAGPSAASGTAPGSTSPAEPMKWREKLGLDETHAVNRNLRLPETLQAHRRISPRLPPPRPPRTARQNDPRR